MAVNYRGVASAGGGFQKYSAGAKRYGPSGNPSPNFGPVSDLSGYVARDSQAAARRNLVLKRMQLAPKSNYTIM